MSDLPKKTLIFRVSVLLTLLVLTWWLWSGLPKPLLLGLGVFSCILTAYLSHRMAYFDNEIFALHFGLRLVRYWVWLAKEIVRSSLDVARIVLNPKLPISPTIVEIDASESHPVDQVILGNSITLTPGTLALDVHRGVIKVHCLTQEGAEDLMGGEMERRVASLRED